VEDGKKVLSNIIATQIPFHKPFDGVVPEIASRKHTEWIYDVVKEALDKAGLKPGDIDAVAVTNRPGLLGSLIVGVSFAKAFAWARNIPLIAVDHMLAHLYASQLDTDQPSCDNKPLAYPFLGLLVSGGHSIICRANSFDDITVLGATIDDAAGEAFDKVAKHYNFGYPGGAVIDKMSHNGDSGAFRFPLPSLHKGPPSKEGAHRCDVSYSGLKNAVINQLDLFRIKKDACPEDIAASFQKTAVEILLRALLNASQDSGLTSIAAGGGVAANSYLRARLAEQKELNCVFPSPEFCGDNGAMIAGIACRYLSRGDRSPLSITASARVEGFKKKYP
jgi:N6-L-threonylcarbamoyladenine synthase